MYMQMPKGAIPKIMALVLAPMGLSVCPTHVLAMYSTVPDHKTIIKRTVQDPWKRQRVYMLPVHGVSIAAACSNLPRLPASKVECELAQTEPHLAFTLNVPVVPLRVPDIDTIRILIDYIYFANPVSVRDHLMPNELISFLDNNKGLNLSRDAYIRKLVEAVDLDSLYRQACHTYGFYMNVVAFGVADKGLWDTINYVWSTLAGAIRLQTRWGAKPGAIKTRH